MIGFGEVCVVHLLGNCVLLCVFYFACLVSCVLCRVCSVLQVSLDRPLLIPPSVSLMFIYWQTISHNLYSVYIFIFAEGLRIKVRGHVFVCEGCRFVRTVWFFSFFILLHIIR
jgi:hypothetical protein